jgi:hypothetical protein
VIISDKYKFIFVRIPKNASTSMFNALRALDPDAYVSSLDVPPYSHETGLEARKIAGEEKWSTYFKFAFLREPKSRLVSHYTYNLRQTFNRQTQLHWLLEKDLKFPNPIGQLIDKDMFVRFHVYNSYWSLPHKIYRQIDWIEDGMWLGDVANIQKDWDYVCSKIGKKINLEIQNKSTSAVWRLDSEADKLYKIFYADDIDYYTNYLKQNADIY